MIIFDEPSLKKKKINIRGFTLSTPSDYLVFALSIHMTFYKFYCFLTHLLNVYKHI